MMPQSWTCGSLLTDPTRPNPIATVSPTDLNPDLLNLGPRLSQVV